MPIYEYRCLTCDAVFSRLFRRYADAATNELCPECGGDQTRRLMSTFAVRGRADPGPGRAAWPTSWEDTGGGDPETLRYWRRRIERDARLEEKYPELRDPALRNGSGTATDTPQPPAHAHHHEHEHPHSHEHSHASGEASSGEASSSEASDAHAAGGAHSDSGHSDTAGRAP